MATIPLPALHINPPVQQENPVEQYGRILQLRNMQALAPLVQQEAQQRVQSGQIDLEQKQQDQKDMQTFRAAMQDPALQGQTYGKIANVLASKGAISPRAYQFAKKMDLEQQKELTGMDTAKLENAAKATAANKQLLGSVMSLPDEAVAQNWPQIVEQYNQIPGNEKRPLDPNQPLTKDQLQMQGPLLVAHQAYIDDELKRRETQATVGKTTAQAAKEQYELAQMQQNGGLTAAQKEMAGYHQQEIGIRNKQLGIEGARLAFEKSKEAAMTGPEGASGLVDAIGTGKIAVDRLGFLVAKNPGLLEAVSAKYPDFDSSKAGAYVAAYKDFTSTKTNTAGGALNAGATALGHLKELKDMNTVASHIPGTPAYNAYMNKVDTVATELAKFYGDSTVSGIGAIRKTLASTLPGTRDAAIATQAQSMGDKFDAYQQSWENAAPSQAYQAPMPGISEKAIEARAALDPKFHASQVTKATAPKVGDTKTFPNGKTGKWDGTGWVAQ